jgi:hypothetical protein
MMHDFVYYDERTGEVTGSFRTSTPELLPKPLVPYQRQVRVTDDEHRRLLRERSLRASTIAGLVRDERIVSLELRARFDGRIVLKCDRPDLDGDGLPELPADGHSTARVTATVVAMDGTTRAEVTAPIAFQVSRGSLSRRRAQPEQGAANVEVRSVTETIRIDITASAEGFEGAALAIEIIPVDEYETLSQSRKAR